VSDTPRTEALRRRNYANVGRALAGALEAHANMERERNELIKALRKVIDTNEVYARLALMAENARNNFSDPSPELDAFQNAISDASVAEHDARALLAKYPISPDAAVSVNTRGAIEPDETQSK
jgi:hypothetical protein